ncbi:MAG: membrane protein insertase YidC, partial [Candidatus Rokuibacteriota bacterium]
PEPPREARPRPPQRLATVETPRYTAVVSSEGGKLQQLTLDYRGEKPLVILGDLGPAGLLLGPEGSATEPVPMRLSAERLEIDDSRPRGDLVLSGHVGDLAVRETMTFDAHTFAVDVRVQVTNSGTEPRGFEVALPWITRQTWKDVEPAFWGQYPDQISWQTRDGTVSGIARSESGAFGRDTLCTPHSVKAEGPWISMGSPYYLAALVQRSGGLHLRAVTEATGACEAPGTQPAGRAFIELRGTKHLAPGEAWEADILVYAGPKEYETLRALDLVGTIDFGGFPLFRAWGMPSASWLGIPILMLLTWLYGFIGNYGVVIIIITIVSKLLSFPLTLKSMRSMKAMQALAPQINALRSKHKSDPQRVQRETLELYRKHKVNPAGGCLPMIAQIPIFYALYLALSVSVELQNAPFLCVGNVAGVDIWICDLASYDPLYILPILMGVTMFIQQRLTPIVGDPRQAKMMLVMPFVFTFMFLNLPSGLVLYWFVSNVLQILQQKWMDRPGRERATREAKDAGRA